MNFKPLTISSLLLAGIAISPLALAHGSFDGHYVNAKFELWNSDDVTSLKEIINEQDVFASDYYYPDEVSFSVSTEDVYNFEWDLDFSQQTIELTYYSIEIANEHDDSSYQYMYDSPQGFHFQDSEDNLPDIINVTVDPSFAPYGLDPKLVTFDKDNIYVNLNGSMCLYIAMPGKPGCTNPDSPTGYNNLIKLLVEFAYDERIDALFDAIETKYDDLFPGPEESFYILGYYARYYPETGLYMGTLNGRLYGYGGLFGGLLDAGTMDTWYEQLQIPD